METEELIKLVDGIYKNILDKFNPGARQMINAGKAYLKALHGAAAASRLYVEAITKLARQAQQGTWGGSADVGTALMKIVEVYKEIQDQQMNILKAFYVDLLVPLETNLEKDTKVVQCEQKRFLQQHKQRSETYSKAAATMKKQRKKSRASSKGGIAMDKELKNMQVLEEEKTKLDAFCEQSLKNAMTQERRRYGFVLERQCSLAKHYLSYHTQAVSEYQQNIEEWSEVAKTREFLPESVENMFSNRMRQVSIWADDDLYSNPRSPHFDDDRMSITSQLRKTKSMDASCLDIRSIEEVGSPMLLSRAKSEYNLTASNHSIAQESNNTPTRRPKSMAVPPAPHWDTQLARALYAYLSSGDNQLSFLEGDVIALIGDRNKGWQFGENLRTQQSGWFPLAYTEVMDDTNSSPSHRADGRGTSSGTLEPSGTPTGSNPSNTPTVETPAPRMFGDTLHLHRSSNNSKQIRRVIGSNTNHIPPPALPAPVPTPTVPFTKSGLTQSQSTNFPSSQNQTNPSTFGGGGGGGSGVAGVGPGNTTTMMKTSASSFNFTTPSTGVYSTHPQPAKTERPTGVASLPLHLQSKGGKIGGPVGNVSLHSSNDSGFSNDPPPQPEVDYSDDESIAGQTKPTNRKSYRNARNDDNNNMRKLPPVRHSNSSSNLIDSRYYQSDDQNTLLRSSKLSTSIQGEPKRANGGIVKRTKSFWRFGRQNSDNEILEGMALWKHRDLVDVNEKSIEAATIERSTTTKRERPPLRKRRPSRDRSNDSDKTLNAKQYDENKNGNGGEISAKGGKVEGHLRHRPSFKEEQKLSLPMPRQKADLEFDNNFDAPDDQFYDDGDGLMLRTVNRKNILQQYSNDSTGSESDSESIITSDDPYDCIVVDDQTTKKVKKNSDKFPNVAELGKKLEKLSKSTKYSPDGKEGMTNIQMRNAINEKNNNVSLRNERNVEKTMKSDADKRDIIKYRDSSYSEQRHSFGTFGHEERNVKSDEQSDKETYRPENNRNSKKPTPKQRSERNNVKQDLRTDTEKRDKRVAPERRKINTESERKDKLKYYSERIDVSADEYSGESVDNRQFLPRTKLSKSSTSTLHDSAYEHESGLMEYGETLQHRLKSPDYGAKFDEKSAASGNMYGPWYDLWGLDSSVRK